MEDSMLTNIVVDEGRSATPVILSRKLGLLMEEANKMITEFYEKNKSRYDIWAAYAVCGSRTHDPNMHYTAICHEKDLDSTKRQFKTLHNVSVFSIQTVRAKHLHSLLSRDRLEDPQFFRSDSEGNVERLEAMKRTIEQLNMDLQRDCSDICIAMNHLLGIDEKHKSPSKRSEPKKAISPAPQQQKMNDLFKKACERPKTPKNSPRKEVRKSPWKKDESNSDQQSNGASDSLKQPQQKTNSQPKNMSVDEDVIPQTTSQPAVKKNLSDKFSTSSDLKAKKLNKDIFDDEDCSPEKSEMEEPAIKTPAKVAAKKRSASAPKHVGKSANSSDSETGCNADAAPLKKRKIVKSIETFKDEDGFLVTKEIPHVVESDEPEEEHTKPLRPANSAKVAAARPKKTGGSGSQKISDFFAKK